MSKLVLNNVEFPFDTGLKLLKLKEAECPFPEVQEDWDNAKEVTFAEIAMLENLEQRRVGFDLFGTERLLAQAEPTLMDSKTIQKTTNYIDVDGTEKTVTFEDTYEVFKIDGAKLDAGNTERYRSLGDAYYVKCKDTSTDREYIIWVQMESVMLTNEKYGSIDDHEICAIECIAWTIQTNIAKGSIEKIIRQGDCVMVKPTPTYELAWRQRHLTKDEYLNLIVAES